MGIFSVRGEITPINRTIYLNSPGTSFMRNFDLSAGDNQTINLKVEPTYLEEEW